MQDHYVADAHDQVAGGFFCEQRREFFLLVFEIREFDFDQLVLAERFIYGLNKAFAQPGFADFQDWFQKLRLCFKFPNLS